MTAFKTFLKGYQKFEKSCGKKYILKGYLHFKGCTWEINTSNCLLWHTQVLKWDNSKDLCVPTYIYTHIYIHINTYKTIAVFWTLQELDLREKFLLPKKNLIGQMGDHFVLCFSVMETNLFFYCCYFLQPRKFYRSIKLNL